MAVLFMPFSSMPTDFAASAALPAPANTSRQAGTAARVTFPDSFTMSRVRFVDMMFSRGKRSGDAGMPEWRRQMRCDKMRKFGNMCRCQPEIAHALRDGSEFPFTLKVFAIFRGKR